MSTDENEAEQVEALFETPNLADALESERFKQFLDHVPVRRRGVGAAPFRTADLRQP